MGCYVDRDAFKHFEGSMGCGTQLPAWVAALCINLHSKNIASGIEGDGVGSGSCLSDEGGDQSVLDQAGGKRRHCARTLWPGANGSGNISFLFKIRMNILFFFGSCKV